MYEVKPIFKDHLEIDDEWKTKDTYRLAEKSFKFWEGDADDNLFDESIKL